MDGSPFWFVVLDDRGARLFRGRVPRRAGRPTVRLDEVDAVDNPWLELDERPSSDVPRHHSGDRRAELLARYALDLSRWMAEAVQRQRIDALDVLAPARLENLLRSIYAQSLGVAVEFHRVDLGAQERGELEQERRILQLAERRSSRRAS